ncbi:MAG: DUF4097 family beta strand repeat-containing protein [Saprospiraceae bacterium]|nr:DUF4097 family beta strand repeat protein [Lewinella sp.]
MTIHKHTLSFALFLFVFLLGSSSSLQAQAPEIKKIEKSFASKSELSIEHRYGPLTVLPATDGKISITGTLYGEAAEAEDLELLRRYFEFEVQETGSTLEVITHFKVRNWNSRNGVTKLEFQDGTRTGKLRNLRIEAIVRVPSATKLSVSNKYDEIRIENGLNNDLHLNVYSGRMVVGDINGKLVVESKYSKGSIGNFGDGTLELYDCDLQFGNGKTVKLTSKYSELEMGSFDNMDADTYDDKISWKTIKGELTLQDKYSEFKIGRFNNGRLDIYDADIVSDGGNELLVKSKYSDFTLKEVGRLSFENSYDDNVKAERVGSFSSTSKYTEYEFGNLRNKIYLRSYDDELKIDQMDGPLEGIDFEGKYTDLKIVLPNNTEFQLEVNMTYGDFKYPESRFESQIYKEKNDRLEMNGKTKGATDSSPKIKIVAYDGDISIQ